MIQARVGTPLLLAAALLIPLAGARAADIERVIPNTLNETWPGELVSFDLEPGALKSPATATIQGVTRPVQIEETTVDGRKISRAWTVATIAWKDEAGNPIERSKEPGKPDIARVKAVLRPGTAPSELRVNVDGDYHVVDNGIHQFRIRKFTGDFPEPRPIEKVDHWLGGMRVAGQTEWDGSGAFEGNAPIKGAKTEILQQGPVFVDFKITLYSAEPPPTATVQARPLDLGKQSFRYKPNDLPLETVPKYENRYEVVVRIVAGDPWVDVNERFRFPRDPAIKPWGFNQHRIGWGGPTGMKLDTAMWVRWFEWDVFGGNTDLIFAPAEMRPAQKGRPFTMLRPIWNQGPGGSQEFFLTSGGATPKDTANATGTYNPEAPAVGVFAAYASKWVGPFMQTIVARAENGNSGDVRMPLTGADGTNDQFHYGQRAYGLCAGPRRLFDNTGKMNGMVRRHTDWTLNALINKYVLEWPRDPSKAGPSILITRERLAKLQELAKADPGSPEGAILQETGIELEKLEKESAEADSALKARREAVAALPEPERKAAEPEIKGLDEKARELKGKLGSADMDLARLVLRGTSKSVAVPDAGLYRERRYQDDFLNPTQAPVRRIAGLRLLDLYANGKPVGGPDLAALAYIINDPDAWMGWRLGWMPGNPNFHTDKYMGAIYIGAAMRDHPHSAEWLEYGRLNFTEDLAKVLDPPDGVGLECPGYSGYALNTLLAIGQIFQNIGFGNFIADNPLVKKTGIWHRKLLTPPDARIGRRHTAPIGDTHRWDSGLTWGFGRLATFYRKADPAFASEMMSTWRHLEKAGVGAEGRSKMQLKLIDMDYSLPETPLDKMDWSSQAFLGFGAVLRDGFGTAKESFLTLKAGWIRGHYHNDDLSYHFYSGGTPVSLDYNCSYHPRGDHAALHNTLTFGRADRVMNNQRNAQVDAMEQIHGTGKLGAFIAKPAADLTVSERNDKQLVMSPVYPQDSEFQRQYPSREVAPITHRRLLMLVKDPDQSPMEDYLVVRDETASAEPQQLNIHLLARDAKAEGNRITATGQWDKDMVVQLVDATEPRIDLRAWSYEDEWMFGPEEYAIREGETLAAWDARMRELMKQHKTDRLPLPGFKPLYKNALRGETKPWLERIAKTGGQALIPPVGWNGTWTYGEYQKWARIETKPGTPILWVLYPHKRGTPAPAIEPIDGGKGVRVSLGGISDEITLGSDAGATLKRGSETTVLLDPAKLPPLGKITGKPADLLR